MEMWNGYEVVDASWVGGIRFSFFSWKPEKCNVSNTIAACVSWDMWLFPIIALGESSKFSTGYDMHQAIT